MLIVKFINFLINFRFKIPNFANLDFHFIRAFFKVNFINFIRLIRAFIFFLHKINYFFHIFHLIHYNFKLFFHNIN
jgi:hypothetical protein